MGLKQRYDVIQSSLSGYDSLNCPIYADKVIRTIEMIVVPKEFKSVKDGLLTIETKHLGLTTDKDLKRGMKIRALSGGDEYIVEHPNNIARLAQITMRRVEYGD